LAVFTKLSVLLSLYNLRIIICGILVTIRLPRGDHVLVLANYVDRDGTEFVLILHNNITCYIESDSLDFPV